MLDSQTDKMINQLADFCKPVVEQIEASLPICQDHYDDYMIAIESISQRLPSANASVKLAIGIALQRAGASKRGVTNALRSLGVI